MLLLSAGARAQEMGGEYDYSNYAGAGMEAPMPVAGNGRARRQGVLMNFACASIGYLASNVYNRGRSKALMKKAQSEAEWKIMESLCGCAGL